MTARRVTPDAAVSLRDSIERTIYRAVRSTMITYLAEVEQAATATTTLTASGEEATLGKMAGAWAAGVESGTVLAIERAFERAWRAYSTLDPSQIAQRTYLAAVRDRLVRGTHFGVTVYEESFEAVRRSLAQSVAEGWSRPQLAERIAAELSWETDGKHWRSVRSTVDSQIDSILDPIGPPGHPAREYARLNDPRVKALRAQRNIAIRHLDAERSVWQTRATLIARTEATGVANYGAIEAMAVEGAQTKMWMATGGGRTRLTHALASGQEVALDKPFEVGGYAMQHPGDPNGPVEEVANCRCSVVNGDNLTPEHREVVTGIATERRRAEGL